MQVDPLLQGIPTQESNPGLSHHKQTLYHLSHQGSPEHIATTASGHTRECNVSGGWPWEWRKKGNNSRTIERFTGSRIMIGIDSM